MDPLTIKELDLNAGQNLKLKMNNIKVEGLAQTKVTTLEYLNVDQKKKKHFDNFFFSADTVNKKFHIVLEIPKLTVIAKYVISGQILVLPISGEGPCKVGLTGVRVEETIDYNLVKKNGKEYIVASSKDAILTMKNVTFQLDNLFNGNKQLGECCMRAKVKGFAYFSNRFSGDNMNKLLNDNPLEASKELANPVGQEIIAGVTEQIMNSLFGVVPYDEVFIL